MTGRFYRSMAGIQGINTLRRFQMYANMYGKAQSDTGCRSRSDEKLLSALPFGL